MLVVQIRQPSKAMEQKSQRYDPTEPLQNIDEGVEKTDTVWLEDNVNEQAVNPVQSAFDNSDGGSPLERLLQSISSDGEDVATGFRRDSEEESTTEPTFTRKHSKVKAYYDPTSPVTKESEEGPVEDDLEDDSEDGVNTLPKVQLEENAEKTVATFTSIMLYRYLFGKGFGNFSKTQDINVGGTLRNDDNDQLSEKESEDNVSSTDSGSITSADNEAESPAKRETAENLPHFLISKVKNLLSKSSSGSATSPSGCPVCGHDLSGEISHDELVTRLRVAMAGRVQWLDHKYARLVTPLPKEVYKTELRLAADGTRSISESYYRMPQKF